MPDDEFVERTAREERDNSLVVVTVVNAALTYHSGYQAWLYEEVKELGFTIDAAIPLYGDEPKLQRMLQQRLDRVRMMERYDIPESLAALKDRIDEIDDGAYENIIDARRYINDGFLRLEDLVRDLLETRRTFDDLEHEGQAAGDPDEGT